ncbi:MAG: hypothetical protein V1729_00010 [Candidatus Woesearchaeota archaeon]
MKRKVIKLANNTLVMSLPSAWVKRVGLVKGDQVQAEESGDALLISTTGSDKTGRFVLDCNKIDFDKNLLSYLYQKGYDEVELVNIDSKSFSKVKERVSDLMGFELIDHSEKRCVVKSVSKEMESEFDNLLRRTFLITLEMSRHLLDAINKKEWERIPEIRDLEKTTNTFTDFCKRVLSKGRYSDPENTTYMYVIVRDLEKIGDGYKRICDVLIPSKGKSNASKLSKRLLETLHRANLFLEMFYKLFYRFDPVMLTKLKAEGKSVKEDVEVLLRRCSHDEALIASNILFIVSTIYDLIGPYMILKFDMIKNP